MSKPFASHTAAEQEFIDQMARKMSVDWAQQQLAMGSLQAITTVYHEYAKSKKWLSPDGTRLLAAGFQTAARFLKR